MSDPAPAAPDEYALTGDPQMAEDAEAESEGGHIHEPSPVSKIGGKAWIGCDFCPCWHYRGDEEWCSAPPPQRRKPQPRPTKSSTKARDGSINGPEDFAVAYRAGDGARREGLREAFGASEETRRLALAYFDVIDADEIESGDRPGN